MSRLGFLLVLFFFAMPPYLSVAAISDMRVM